MSEMCTAIRSPPQNFLMLLFVSWTILLLETFFSLCSEKIYLTKGPSIIVQKIPRVNPLKKFQSIFFTLFVS